MISHDIKLHQIFLLMFPPTYLHVRKTKGSNATIYSVSYKSTMIVSTLIAVFTYVHWLILIIVTPSQTYRHASLWEDG